MKKSTTLLGALLISGFAFSQVGINTDQPKATFDIVASPSDVAKTDGFIAPRLKGSELKAKDALYAGSQTGAIVYITQALLPVDTTVKTTNVTAVGYFYFDGAVWQKIGNGGGVTEPWNIQGTTNPATVNTQNIYQTGSVGVGKNSVYANGVNPVMLDVEGAVRGGTLQTGIVGVNSVAFGEGNSASEVNSVAIGTNNTASGNLAIAFGIGTTANGDRAMALGLGSEASGQYSLAMGNSIASGTNSTAMGLQTTASGMNSTAMGNNTEASNNFATATGVNNVASGIGSFAAGRNNVASSISEFVVGHYNAIRTGNPGGDAATDAIFQVGNGSSMTEVHNNAMTILKSGKTGIAITGIEATAKPTEFLDLGTGTARVRNLPANGAANSIYTQSNGTASATQNQTFNAIRTVVSDANGVLGYVAGTPATEPWNIQGTTNPATINTQDIYQAGKVSIGKNASAGLLSVYGGANQNTIPFYLGYTSNIDSSVTPWMQIAGNLGGGSFSDLSQSGDQALVFSTDNNATSYSQNGLLITPHTAGAGATPFGFKITEQGMLSFNAKFPTETFDLAGGTMRIRNLPANGTANAIYTTPGGAASVPFTTNLSGLAKTQTFTATKTVVADANGVLGYVDGLPETNPSGVQNLTYARKTVSPLNASTPTDSEVSIGNITFRFNGTSSSAANIEYKVSQSNHVTILYHKGGSGGTNLEEWGRQASVAGTWYSLTGEVGNATRDINPGNRDIAYAIITLHNTKDVYRVTANTNGDIAASGGVPTVASSITLFVEKLQ